MSGSCDPLHHVIHDLIAGEMTARGRKINCMLFVHYHMSYTMYCYSSESVLAAEVVQIFCLVPTFIDTLIDQSHPGNYL